MGGKILVVEDNEDSRFLAAKVLRIGGFTVIESASGEEAVKLAESEQPDAVLMDLGLPGMDGLSAAGLIKSNPATASIPVIALTAYASEGDREKTLKAGCEGYISKPIDIRAFPGQVEGFLKGRRG